MHRTTETARRTVLRLTTLSITALFVATACASSGSAGWTYAPLGPTPGPTGSAAPSAGPSGSPGQVVNVQTTDAAPQAFEPNVLEAPAATSIQVDYLNDNALSHNIVFFDGPDSSASRIAETEAMTGPDNLQSVTFTTPAEAGDYYFWCDVHGAAMAGTLAVTAGAAPSAPTASDDAASSAPTAAPSGTP